MADLHYMKAVEYDKLPVKFKKAHSFESLEATFWLQKKYDGCFGKATIRKDRTLCSMQSRTGEDYSISCALILNDLHESWDGEDFVALGEVWTPNERFPKISGDFRRQSTGPCETLLFVLNDVLPVAMCTSVPYWQRFQNASLVALTAGKLMLAKTYTVGDWGGAQALARVWVAEGGYDGAILRNPQSGYTFGLVKLGEIVKVKPLLELDLMVDDLLSTPGEKTGRAVWTIKVTYRGVQTTVGSGMPHTTGELPYPKQIVRIDSLGLTEDGKLREPRYIGIRHDKDQPDR